MATTTANIGLCKPDKGEYYNIDVFNCNIDKIDEQIFYLKNRTNDLDTAKNDILSDIESLSVSTTKSLNDLTTKLGQALVSSENKTIETIAKVNNLVFENKQEIQKHKPYLHSHHNKTILDATRFIILNNLSNIGIEKGNETIKQIVEAMPNFSILIIDINDRNNMDVFPTTGGILSIKKITNIRCDIEYTNATTDERWTGVYYNFFRGWTKRPY